MKYVAKVDAENYLFSISYDEILILMYGEQRPQYDESKKKEVYDFLDKLDKGKIADVSFAAKAVRILDLYEKAKRLDSWDGFVSRMEQMKKMFEPVKEYIEKFKEI